jgi:hypothetical protein
VSVQLSKTLWLNLVHAKKFTIVCNRSEFASCTQRHILKDSRSCCNWAFFSSVMKPIPYIFWRDILRMENQVFGKSQCSAKFFLCEIWVDYVRNVCKKLVYCCFNIPQIWPILFFWCFKLNTSSISHQQAVVENFLQFYILQSKDVASGPGATRYYCSCMASV